MLPPVGGALVTGAGGGLGLAIARALGKRGLKVRATDLDAAVADQAAASIPGATGLALDVRDAEACGRAAQEIVEADGSLDVWVNNAGVLLPGLSFEQDIEAHRTMLEVNALGTYNGTLAAIGQMRTTGRGHVINVVSLAGLIAPPGEVGYAASKHAAMAFTLGTLADLRSTGIKDIQLSAVCPDGVWTPMIQDKLDDPNSAPSFSGKMLMPDEVAEQVAGLLERPRPVLTIPRWRGQMARFFDRYPRLASTAAPLLMADARRRQRRFKKRVDAGRWPPT
jgi:NAD(P)-dependent dehydrogenase (short-subunit alcohol dehydrogenase family)